MEFEPSHQDLLRHPLYLEQLELTAQLEIEVAKEMKRNSMQRIDLEENHQKLMIRDNEISRKELDSVRKCTDAEMDNNYLKREIQLLHQDLKSVQRDNNLKLKLQEDRIRKNEAILDELEKNHRHALDKVINDHKTRVREIARQWDERCRTLEERIKLYDTATLDTQNELRRQTEFALDFRRLNQEIIEQNMINYRDLARANYETSLRINEAKIRTLLECNDIIYVENQRMQSQIQLNEVKSRQELAFLDSEANRLKVVKEDLDKKNNEAEILAGRMKNDLGLKKTMLERFSEEIKEIKEREKAKKDANKKLLASLKDEQKKDVHERENQRKEQQKKLSELQKQLRKIHSENMRLREEYQKLAEVVQNQVSSEIYKTFEENDFF